MGTFFSREGRARADVLSLLQPRLGRRRLPLRHEGRRGGEGVDHAAHHLGLDALDVDLDHVRRRQVEDRRTLADPVPEDGEVHVMQALSGG